MPERSRDAPVPTAESYVWPLTALVVVILPQVLVPARMRLGPPSVVPIVEGIVVLLALAVAAKPGPVPRAARPLMLWLFGVLVLANTAAAARLVDHRSSRQPRQRDLVQRQSTVGGGCHRACNEHRHLRLAVLATRRGRTHRAPRTPCALPRLSVPSNWNSGTVTAELAPAVPGSSLCVVHERGRRSAPPTRCRSPLESRG